MQISYLQIPIVKQARKRNSLNIYRRKLKVICNLLIIQIIAMKKALNRRSLIQLFQPFQRKHFSRKFLKKKNKFTSEGGEFECFEGYICWIIEMNNG